ncbi:hypothetical protein M427DRAFT_147906 [Gonapodya prolifera JEL478]|uniref:Uncharacterized protein n=1 Tax=Gonapodya prolifera (strain JEL478) TaxID=1344416 RepID=A0A139A375_GONPJ|nr:hypothetical protein M427DRAFT_147906 [Gonapodya prolifera JEL478]|eukprot:KXS11266.1 hypothetical protein M427DRAFT_147906 [Gonapodya prolifera JEL478]
MSTRRKAKTAASASPRSLSSGLPSPTSSGTAAPASVSTAKPTLSRISSPAPQKVPDTLPMANVWTVEPQTPESSGLHSPRLGFQNHSRPSNPPTHPAAARQPPPVQIDLHLHYHSDSFPPLSQYTHSPSPRLSTPPLHYPSTPPYHRPSSEPPPYTHPPRTDVNILTGFRVALNLPLYDPHIRIELELSDYPIIAPTPPSPDSTEKLRLILEKKEVLRRKLLELERAKAAAKQPAPAPTQQPSLPRRPSTTPPTTGAGVVTTLPLPHTHGHGKPGPYPLLTPPKTREAPIAVGGGPARMNRRAR